MTLPLKKLYIDSSFRNSLNDDPNNFTIDLKESLNFEENTKMYADDISIPHTWYSVQEDYNNILYIRLQSGNATTDSKIVLTSGNYTPSTFITHLSARLNHHLSNVTHTLTYDQSTMSILLNFASFTHRFLTDNELKTGVGISPNYGVSVDTNNLNSANELINNRNISSVGSASVNKSYFLILEQIRNIYISSNLSDFSTKSVNGSQDIIKKVSVSSPFGSMIVDQIKSNNDYVNVSNHAISTVKMSLRDIKGELIPLHGCDWSCTLVFSLE